MTCYKGFTLIEILVALVIISLAVSVVIVSLTKFDAVQALEESVDLATAVIDEARAKTLASKDASKYGVHIEASQLVLFQGSAYSPLDPNNVAAILDDSVEIRDIALTGGGSNIVFERLTGSTLEYGSFELFLKASSTVSRTISISATGIVSASF